MMFGQKIRQVILQNDETIGLLDLSNWSLLAVWLVYIPQLRIFVAFEFHTQLLFVKNVSPFPLTNCNFISILINLSRKNLLDWK